MSVLRAGGGFDACGQDSFGFYDAVLLDEHLGVHQIDWNVVRGGLDNVAEMPVGGYEVVFFEEFNSERVVRKRIVGILLGELL